MTKLAKQFFSMDSAMSYQEDKGSSGPGSRRIVFPIVLEAFGAARNELQMPHFKQSLVIVGGYPMVHAWYLAMAQALSTGNVAWHRSLWQCALTVTIQVRICSVQDAILQALLFSEKLTVNEAALTDAFLTFASKVRALQRASGTDTGDAQAQTKAHLAMGLKYRGADYHINMHRTVLLLGQQLLPSHLDVLRQIEAEFGRDVLTVSWAKLLKLLTLVQNRTKARIGDFDVSECFQFTFEALLMDLRQDFAKPSKFSAEFLEKRRGGQIGWVRIQMRKLSGGLHAPAHQGRFHTGY